MKKICLFLVLISFSTSAGIAQNKADFNFSNNGKGSLNLRGDNHSFRIKKDGVSGGISIPNSDGSKLRINSNGYGKNRSHTIRSKYGTFRIKSR